MSNDLNVQDPFAMLLSMNADLQRQLERKTGEAQYAIATDVARQERFLVVEGENRQLRETNNRLREENIRLREQLSSANARNEELRLRAEAAERRPTPSPTFYQDFRNWCNQNMWDPARTATIILFAALGLILLAVLASCGGSPPSNIVSREQLMAENDRLKITIAQQDGIIRESNALKAAEIGQREERIKALVSERDWLRSTVEADHNWQRQQLEASFSNSNKLTSRHLDIATNLINTFKATTQHSSISTQPIIIVPPTCQNNTGTASKNANISFARWLGSFDVGAWDDLNINEVNVLQVPNDGQPGIMSFTTPSGGIQFIYWNNPNAIFAADSTPLTKGKYRFSNRFITPSGDSNSETDGGNIGQLMLDRLP